MNNLKKKSIRKCPICGEENVEILHTQNFVLPEGHPLSDGYDVVCCDRCGFVYADTIVSQEDYDIFYANLSKYEDQKTATGGGESPCDAERLQKTAECIAEFLPDKNLRILDIGCANGGLLGYLKELGYHNLCGLDPSPVCAETTKQNYGIETYTGSLFQLPQNLGEFDIIILSHVLEHIQDLKFSVNLICQLIKINGSLYIEVPNASEYVSHVFAPFQDFNTEHINHFSHLHLSNLLNQFGFTNQLVGEKVFDISLGMSYPAIYGFWQKQELNFNSSEFVISPDGILKERILFYIESSKKIMINIDIKLQSVLDTSPDVIVWGTGQLAMKLLAETSLAKANIVAFVDGNPINQGNVIEGVTVLSPHEIQSRNMRQPIIITSTISQEAIYNTIKKMNLPNRVVLLG
jgi:2-polyprenyl-3-methyl-5-hydroxy-6-metoxy-1,4-benzoquinol methylase